MTLDPTDRQIVSLVGSVLRMEEYMKRLTELSEALYDKAITVAITSSDRAHRERCRCFELPETGAGNLQVKDLPSRELMAYRHDDDELWEELAMDVVQAFADGRLQTLEELRKGET